MLERLDRALCNDIWMLAHANANVQHLVRVSSDHCPLLIRFGGDQVMRNGVKPFRCFCVWLEHDDVSKLVQHTSSSSGSLPFKLQETAVELYVWN